MTASFTQEKGGRLLALLPMARKHNPPEHRVPLDCWRCPRCASQWVLRGSAELQTNGDQSGDPHPEGAGSRHVVAVQHIKPFCPAQLCAVPRSEHPPCQAVAQALLRAAVAGRMCSALNTSPLGAVSQLGINWPDGRRD